MRPAGTKITNSTMTIPKSGDGFRGSVPAAIHASGTAYRNEHAISLGHKCPELLLFLSESRQVGRSGFPHLSLFFLLNFCNSVTTVCKKKKKTNNEVDKSVANSVTNLGYKKEKFVTKYVTYHLPPPRLQSRNLPATCRSKVVTIRPI